MRREKPLNKHDAVDARNWLAAGELERRWNEKLEEMSLSLNAFQTRMRSAIRCRPKRKRERSIGDRFSEVWQNGHCPPALKKMILRTAIEEIIVRTDQDKKSLELVLHWKGGIHTQLSMDRPRSATDTATPIEALEIIRCMAVRFGDDQIASVFELSRLFYRQRKRWNQTRVATAMVTIPLPVKSEPYLIRRELVWAKQRAYATSVIARSNGWWRPAYWSVKWGNSRTVGNSSWLTQ